MSSVITLNVKINTKKGGSIMFVEKEYSFSSVEDIRDILENFDVTYEFKNVSEKHFNLYIDFTNLTRQVQDSGVSIECVTRYIKVKTGKTDVFSYKSVEEQCADELGIGLEQFEDKLEGEIEELVEHNKKNWLSYIRNNYGEKIELQEPPKRVEKAEVVKQDLKTSGHNGKFDVDIKGMNRDLADYLSYLEEINRKLEELEKEGKKGTSEYSKLTTIKIQVQKDINIIRRSYGDKIGNQNSGGRTSFTPYDHENKEFAHIIEAHEEYLANLLDSQLSEHKKNKLTNKVKKIAREVLTNRQFIIFKLYYFNDLTQQEIAEIVDLKRHSVSEYLTRAVERIKQNL